MAETSVPAPDALLADALRLSERMLAAARGRQWEQVAEMERLRAGVLQSCFGHDHRIQDRGLASRTIRKLLELDRAILALGRARRDQLATELDRLQQGRQASRAYASTRHWPA